MLGTTYGQIIDAQRKSELLELISQGEGIQKSEICAIGDGFYIKIINRANDLLMLGAAGLGIAFNAKYKVQEKVSARINQKSLLNVLYLLGFTEKETNEILDKKQ